MNAVITKAQARVILKGRVPHVPIQYEQAITALQECIELDEAKLWSDKADALAAWAKMYRDDKVSRQAKMLKLRAYRRMGQLAAELNPRIVKQGEGVGKGSVPGSGPRSLLISHGLSVAQTAAARTLAKLPERKFEQVLKHPAEPTTIRSRLYYYKQWHHTQATLMTLRSRCRSHTPAQTVSEMHPEECKNARTLIAEVNEWLDEFDERCAKKEAL